MFGKSRETAKAPCTSQTLYAILSSWFRPAAFLHNLGRLSVGSSLKTRLFDCIASDCRVGGRNEVTGVADAAANSTIEVGNVTSDSNIAFEYKVKSKDQLKQLGFEALEEEREKREMPLLGICLQMSEDMH